MGGAGVGAGGAMRVVAGPVKLLIGKGILGAISRKYHRKDKKMPIKMPASSHAQPGGQWAGTRGGGGDRRNATMNELLESGEFLSESEPAENDNTLHHFGCRNPNDA